jgi:hypothetical protein
MTDVSRKLRLLGLLVLALTGLVNAGCLVAAVGAGAAGAAVAGYTWCNGLLYRDYPATLADSTSAVRAALLEMQFPIVKETSDTGTAFVRTSTGDGHTVRIYLDVVPSPIPAEGALTRVSIRVGVIGDEAVTARILDQVARHLVSPHGLPPASGAAPPVVNPMLLPPRPVAATGPPPLAVPVKPAS